MVEPVKMASLHVNVERGLHGGYGSTEWLKASHKAFGRSIFAHKHTARRSRNHKGRVIGVSALDDHTDTQWVNEGLKWLKDRPGMGSFIL